MTGKKRKTTTDNVADDGEELARIIGRQLIADPASAAWRDERFESWMIREAVQSVEEKPSGVTARSDEDVHRLGLEILARVAARRLGVRYHRSDRPDFTSPEVATPSQAMDDARMDGSAPLVDLAVAAGSGREIWDEPVTEWVHLPPEVPDGRYVAVPVAGDSMAPLMHTGDTVLVQLDVEPQVGRVIVARHPEDGYVCKVVRRVRRTTIELGSLDISRAPISIPRDPRLILGTVILVWCSHQKP